ncbi:MAG: hypothetical protein A2283_01800 [Lentisphaerae bacterium RIFOXYA12_FULL_48_11]|nr:MAG: hypothetical protein A2283_01800 [Lentisphaerae bacterium RIFOXYA12_FULL_48_11]
MKLSEYLGVIPGILKRPEQQSWFEKLEKGARRGIDIYNEADELARLSMKVQLGNRIRTEELKAWYGEPEGNSLFQGTSVTSLTIPHVLDAPLEIGSIEQLEDILADAYIARHREHVDKVRNAIQEDTSLWVREGLYYGVAVCSKLLSQAFGLSVGKEEAVCNVMGTVVDPHEITSYPLEVRDAYYRKCVERISVFQGLSLQRRDIESSLALADISKPRIAAYKDRILLGPVLCNEIAAVMSERLTGLIREKSRGEISPRGLTVVIYDTDTPYTYHQIMGFQDDGLSPVLSGLVVMGASGTIDAFRWLYAYRVSLVAQKIQKSSLYSQVHSRFIPFVFFGVLVWRDAEILLDMDNLHRLRYRGNICPALESAYLLPGVVTQGPQGRAGFDWAEFRKQHNR